MYSRDRPVPRGASFGEVSGGWSTRTGCFGGNSMTQFAPDRENGHDGRTELEPRTERALTEYMSVLPEGGEIYSGSSAKAHEFTRGMKRVSLIGRPPVGWPAEVGASPPKPLSRPGATLTWLRTPASDRRTPTWGCPSVTGAGLWPAEPHDFTVVADLDGSRAGQQRLSTDLSSDSASCPLRKQEETVPATS